MTLGDVSKLLAAYDRLYYACRCLDHMHPPRAILPEMREVWRIKQELGEEANNLEDALSETEADRDRLAAELQAVRDELATAYEEIILSRQSEGDTMADLLATREERDALVAEWNALRSQRAAEGSGG